MAFSKDGYGPNDGPGDDDTAFSGPGAPNISNPRSGGTQVALPTFFVRSNAVPEDELTPSTVETPREKAARADSVDDSGNTQSGAPKL